MQSAERAFLPAKKPFTHLAAPIEGKLFAKLFLEKAEIASPASLASHR